HAVEHADRDHRLRPAVGGRVDSTPGFHGDDLLTAGPGAPNRRPLQWPPPLERSRRSSQSIIDESAFPPEAKMSSIRTPMVTSRKMPSSSQALLSGWACTDASPPGGSDSSGFGSGVAGSATG